MELGNFEKEINDNKIEKIASGLIPDKIRTTSCICEQWREAEDEVREYDVYRIEADEDEDDWYLTHAQALAAEITH